MRTRLTLQPNQNGAKRLRDPYGDRLVCVRYRYDERRRRRCKTAELIVEESEWEPSGGPQAPEKLVQVRVAWTEEELRRRVKTAGGRWNPQRRAWELRYDQVVALGVTDRIVEEGRI